jgi:NADH dehydrogenase/NADH:ubiquinone oxidoreductase subunit G
LHTRNNATTKTFSNTKNILNDQILRILPKINQKINETWISDKTRYSFDGNSFNRNLFLEQKDLLKLETEHYNKADFILVIDEDVTKTY